MMTADVVREYFLSKPEVTEDTPFGPEVLVYKVVDKMFGLLGFKTDSDGVETAQINLKCDPDRSLDLRAEHEAIIPGYHMNKRHWNTLVLGGSLPDELIRELVDHSWDLVVAGLPKGLRPTG